MKDNKTLRIVHILRGTGGGAGKAVLRLNKALQKESADSRIIVCGESDETADDILVLGNGNIRLKILRRLERVVLEHVRRLPEYPFTTSFVGYHISNLDWVNTADIIHLHWICGAVTPKEINRLTHKGKKIVWTFHDIWPMTGGCHVEYKKCNGYEQECKDCPFLKRNVFLAKRVLKNKRRYLNSKVSLIAPSNWMMNCCMRSSLFCNSCVRVIPNAASEYYSKRYTRDEIELVLKEDASAFTKTEYNVLYIATSTSLPFKGFSFLEKVFGLLFERRQDLADRITIHIVGENSIKSEVLQKYRVKEWGIIQDSDVLASIYSSVDMMVNPSLADNLPYTIMEALGCGTPVLSFNTGGIPDLIEHMVNGYLAKYADEEELYRGMIWLLEEADRERLGNAAIEKIKTEFNDLEVARRHIEYYTEL